MFRIKAKNGNEVDVEDRDLAVRALSQGHEVFTFDPDKRGDKPKKWEPEADEADGDQ